MASRPRAVVCYICGEFTVGEGLGLFRVRKVLKSLAEVEGDVKPFAHSLRQ